MSPKTRNIIGWILTSLLALLFLWSAAMKFIGGPEMEKNIAGMGLTLSSLRVIGIVEVLSVLLFIIPRTGILGTLLLAGYLGGAIATHLEHGQPVIMPLIVSCVLWITAAIRFPELLGRLLGHHEGR
jgi:hypothetical protein